MKHRVNHIYFCGIGGIGMSGIAELLHNQGFSVCGSDAAESPNVARLRSLGIEVFIGHRAEQVGCAEVLVFSSAIASDNPEMIEARSRNIPIIPRAEMLAELMRMKQGIAIAGSHGKTTITSMIAHGMEQAGLDPTYVIGGRLIATGHNVRLGESDFLVAEADESDGSFLCLTPTVAVVSNIDPEHLNHYGNFANLMEAFKQFVHRVPFYGRVVLHHEHPNVALLREELNRPMTTYGSSKQADLCLLETISSGRSQQVRFVIRGEGDGAGEFSFTLSMPGRHNAENALAAIAVLRDQQIPLETIFAALGTFSGIQRRFQCTDVGGDIGGGALVDDYAHHPCEIEATLACARSCWPDKKISVVFQPHRYSRTRDLLHDFYGAFDGADEVWLLPIYAASEAPIPGVDHHQMQLGMSGRGHRSVHCCETLADAGDVARKAVAAGQIVILMGAGSIGGLAAALRRELVGA